MTSNPEENIIPRLISIPNILTNLKDIIKDKTE